MKNLLIIGARGYGREIYSLACECVGYERNYIIKGFLDDKSNALDGYINYPPIIGSVEHYEIQEDDIFICALGDVKYKEMYANIILEKGGNFINLIHPTAYIGRNTNIGVGCIMCRYVNISCDVCIGDFATFQPFVTIGHDACIDNYCHLNTYSFMGGGAVIEKGVTLHTSAVLLPKVRAERYSTIGASSVALRKVKEGITVYGNPAVKL